MARETLWHEAGASRASVTGEVIWAGCLQLQDVDHSGAPLAQSGMGLRSHYQRCSRRWRLFRHSSEWFPPEWHCLGIIFLSFPSLVLGVNSSFLSHSGTAVLECQGELSDTVNQGNCVALPATSPVSQLGAELLRP